MTGSSPGTMPVTIDGAAASDPRAALRELVYWLLIVISCATATARIFTIESANGKTPFLSANDRSRWSTVRSLVDHGTYAIDDVIFRADGKRDRDWYSIDIVRHRSRDGHEHFYSSKPPLLATLLAGEYWLIQKITGATLANQPFYVARIMLVLTNVVPFALLIWLMAKMVETVFRTDGRRERGCREGGWREGEAPAEPRAANDASGSAGASPSQISDFARMFVVAATAWGTYLTTMTVTLNNHLPAAVSVAITLMAVLKIFGEPGASSRRWFAIAGFFAAFAVANELPALSLFAVVAALLVWRSWRQTFGWFAPAALVVLAASMITNYLAHESWRPPYAHRNRDGAVLAAWRAKDAAAAEAIERELAQGLVPAAAKTASLGEPNRRLSSQAKTAYQATPGRWVVVDAELEDRFAIVRRGDEFQLRAWDDWYEFEGSYWSLGKQSGVDKGEPSRLAYAFHMLAGHHGFFSLTPIWLLSLFGLTIWLRQPNRTLQGFAAVTLLLTSVCIAFYLSRPLIDRNYGGVSCGFRWLFWLIPLWLLGLVPAVDRWSCCRYGRAIALGLLAVAVFSAFYSANNPWSHPWLFEYWTTLGWIEY